MNGNLENKTEKNNETFDYSSPEKITDYKSRDDFQRMRGKSQSLLNKKKMSTKRINRSVVGGSIRYRKAR